MKLVTYQDQNELRAGIVIDENTYLDVSRAFSALGVVGHDEGRGVSMLDIIAGDSGIQANCRTALDAAVTGKLQDACVVAGDVTLVAPIPRPLKNVFCVGSNYRAHVTEASRAQKKTNDKTPDYPVFFSKPPTAVIGHNEAILIDPKVSEKIDYEVELGVVIGKAGKNIPAENAVDHIFGFTIINDVTARDLQRRHGGQYLKGKGLDTFCPLGPIIVTIDELPNFENLAITLSVNGEIRQSGNTGDMIFPIATLIESLSEGLTLEPGDLIASGTPSGVGYAMEPPQFLKAGDVVTCHVESIGDLSNTLKQV